MGQKNETVNNVVLVNCDKKEGEGNNKKKKVEIKRTKTKIKTPHIVNLACVKVEGTEQVNMPCPPSQLETQITITNRRVLQNKMKDLKATLPSIHASSSATDASLDNLRDGARAETTLPPRNDASNSATECGTAQPTECDGLTNLQDGARADWDDWPEEDSDKELEEEMLRLVIRHEKEKEERFREVERRRKEDDLKFLMDVKSIEDREERLRISRMKTEEAKKKQKEKASPPSSTPEPSPNLQAKMLTGAEPCWVMEKMATSEGKEEEMSVEEGAEPTSIQAGPAPSSSTPGTNTVHLDTPTKQGWCTSMMEHQDDISNKVDMFSAAEVTQEVKKKKESKLQPSQAELKRLQLDKARKRRRLDRMSSSRNFPEAIADPGPTPGASQTVSKLVSKFETAHSPIKMPRPTPASTQACRTSPNVSISQPFLITVNSQQLQGQPGTGSDVIDDVISQGK